MCNKIEFKNVFKRLVFHSAAWSHIPGFSLMHIYTFTLEMVVRVKQAEQQLTLTDDILYIMSVDNIHRCVHLCDADEHYFEWVHVPCMHVYST